MVGAISMPPWPVHPCVCLPGAFIQACGVCRQEALRADAPRSDQPRDRILEDSYPSSLPLWGEDSEVFALCCLLEVPRGTAIQLRHWETAQEHTLYWLPCLSCLTPHPPLPVFLGITLQIKLLASKCLS